MTETHPRPVRTSYNRRTLLAQARTTGLSGLMSTMEAHERVACEIIRQAIQIAEGHPMPGSRSLPRRKYDALRFLAEPSIILDFWCDAADVNPAWLINAYRNDFAKIRERRRDWVLARRRVPVAARKTLRTQRCAQRWGCNQNTGWY
jgi:hypothetical protein